MGTYQTGVKRSLPWELLEGGPSAGAQIAEQPAVGREPAPPEPVSAFSRYTMNLCDNCSALLHSAFNNAKMHPCAKALQRASTNPHRGVNDDDKEPGLPRRNRRRCAGSEAGRSIRGKDALWIRAFKRGAARTGAAAFGGAAVPFASAMESRIRRLLSFAKSNLRAPRTGELPCSRRDDGPEPSNSGYDWNRRKGRGSTPGNDQAWRSRAVCRR